MRLLALVISLCAAADVCLFQYNTPYCGWLVQNETYTCGACRNWSIWTPAPTTLWPEYGAIVDCYNSVTLYYDVNCTAPTTTGTLGPFPFAECETDGSVSWQFNNCSNSEIGNYCAYTYSGAGCSVSTGYTEYSCTIGCINSGSGSFSVSCNNNQIVQYTSPGCSGNTTVLGQFSTCHNIFSNSIQLEYGPCPTPIYDKCVFQYSDTSCGVLSTSTNILNNTCTNTSIAGFANSINASAFTYQLFLNASCTVAVFNYQYLTCYTVGNVSWLVSTANCSVPIPFPPTPTPVPTPTPITPPPPTACLYLHSDLSCSVVATWFNITCDGFCTASPTLPLSAAHSCVSNTTILYQNTSCASAPYASTIGTCQFYPLLFGTQSMVASNSTCPPLPAVVPTPTPTPAGIFCARSWGSVGCGGALINETIGICQQCVYGNFLPNCGAGNASRFFSFGCTGSLLGSGAFGTCIPNGLGGSVIFYNGACPALPAPAPVPAPAPNTCGRFWSPSITCGGTQLQDPVQNYCWNSTSPGLVGNFFTSSVYNSFQFNCNTELVSFFTSASCTGVPVPSSFLIGNCFSFGSYALPMSTSNTSCNLCGGCIFLLII